MKHKRRKIKLFILGFTGLILLKVIWVFLFVVSGQKLITNEAPNDLFTRRSYLLDKVERLRNIEQMHSSMPAFFQGEWAVGTYSMLTAALTNVAFVYPETRMESLKVIDGLLQNMLTDDKFRQFDTMAWQREDALQSLSGPNGHLGYLGHLNFMLAAYHYLGGQNIKYRDLFQKISEALIKKMAINPTSQAETYPKQVFIADNTVAAASIALYERAFQKRGPFFSRQWLSYVKGHLKDRATGL